MDNIIFILIFIIVVIILGLCILKKKELFGFSENDNFFQHKFNRNQRHSYNLFVEDENLLLQTPRVNNVLRDVNELMNHKTEETDIYEFTRVKNKDYTNNMSFW